MDNLILYLQRADKFYDFNFLLKIISFNVIIIIYKLKIKMSISK
jgi:hypothetical protein